MKLAIGYATVISIVAGWVDAVRDGSGRVKKDTA
jgi:hypothetical protein